MTILLGLLAWLALSVVVSLLLGLSFHVTGLETEEWS